MKPYTIRFYTEVGPVVVKVEAEDDAAAVLAAWALIEKTAVAISYKRFEFVYRDGVI